METKEERLRQIIEKLDSKLKSVLIENNELKQRLELAVLDQQLAEEQVQSATEELELLKQRNVELEELYVLNTELEASLASEKADLVQKLAVLQLDLQKAQETKHANLQTYDSLQFELNKCNAQLEAARLSLDVVKYGVNVALAPLIGEDQPWMPLIDLLRVPVEPLIDEFNSGKISSTDLTSKLRAAVNSCIDTMLESPSRFPPFEMVPKLITLKSSPEADRVKVNLELIQDLESKTQTQEPQDSSVRPNSTEFMSLSRNLEETIMRNDILETKLKKALLIAEEVESLRSWQSAAIAREEQLKLQVNNLQAQTNRLQIQLNEKKRQDLPYELAKLSDRVTYRRLNQTVAFLNRSTSAPLLLSDLERKPVKVVSKLVGNPRTKQLREIAKSMTRGQNSVECRKLGLQQEINLMQI